MNKTTTLYGQNAEDFEIEVTMLIRYRYNYRDTDVVIPDGITFIRNGCLTGNLH